MTQPGAESWDDTSVLPVSVIMGCSEKGRWELMGAVVGRRFASERRERTCIRSGPEGELFMWSGFRLRLRPAEAEAYYLNLRNDQPALFVIGVRDGTCGFLPERVTVSLDDAQNLDATELRSSDQLVFHTGMPPEVYRWLEAFVMRHYEPRRKGGKGRGKRRSSALYDAEVGDFAGDPDHVPGGGNQ